MAAPKNPNTKAANDRRRDPLGRVSKTVRVLALPEVHEALREVTPEDIGELVTIKFTLPGSALLDPTTKTTEAPDARLRRMLAEYRLGIAALGLDDSLSAEQRRAALDTLAAVIERARKRL